MINAAVPAILGSKGEAAAEPVAGGPFASFATPTQTDDVFDLVAEQHTRAVAEVFLARCGDELKQCSDGLLSLLEGWLVESPTPNQACHPNVGLVRRALDPDDGTSPVTAAAALALQLHVTGTAGSWTVRLPARAALLWDRWRLPTTAELRVQAACAQAELEVATDAGTKIVRFNRNDRGWASGELSAYPRFVLAGRRLHVVAPAGIESSDLLAGASQPQVESSAGALQQAAQLLDAAAPEFSSWVASALWGVVPASPVDASLISGSVRSYPWLVMTCCPEEPEQLAELLVHEGSHQYFYLLSHFGAVDDGSDLEFYYSPLKETGRPISAILLAYHACGNMLLMYRLLRERGRATELSREREATLFEQVKIMDAHLRATRALTDLGRALWLPLAARLNAGTTV